MSAPNNVAKTSTKLKNKKRNRDPNTVRGWREPLTPGGLHYIHRGQGDGKPKIFIVPGFATDTHYFEGFILLLEKWAEVVLPDLRGCERTPGSTDMSFWDMADDINELIEALQWKEAHYIGTSMGGWVLQLVGMHNRDRIKTLTFTNSMLTYNFWERMTSFSFLYVLPLLTTPSLSLASYHAMLLQTSHRAFNLSEITFKLIEAFFVLDSLLAIYLLARLLYFSGQPWGFCVCAIAMLWGVRWLIHSWVLDRLFINKSAKTLAYSKKWCMLWPFRQPWYKGLAGMARQIVACIAFPLHVAWDGLLFRRIVRLRCIPSLHITTTGDLCIMHEESLLLWRAMGGGYGEKYPALATFRGRHAFVVECPEVVNKLVRKLVEENKEPTLISCGGGKTS